MAWFSKKEEQQVNRHIQEAEDTLSRMADLEREQARRDRERSVRCPDCGKTFSADDYFIKGHYCR
jgi:hypothetical protein